MALKKSELYSSLWSSCDEDAEAVLDGKAYAKYPGLGEDDVKALVVDDKWMGALLIAVRDEMDQVNHGLTQRTGELARRYDTSVLAFAREVADLEQTINGHLETMASSTERSWSP